MQKGLRISIGYSLTDHPELISEFTNEIPSGIAVDSYLQEKYFSADGQFIHLILTFVSAFSEGMVSGLGEAAFKVLMQKVTKLVKGHIAVYDDIKDTKAKFKIRLVNSNGSEKIFEADNVDSTTVDKALEGFIKLAASDQMPTDSKVIYLFDEATKSWSSKRTDEIREYLIQMRKDANERLSD